MYQLKILGGIAPWFVLFVLYETVVSTQKHKHCMKEQIVCEGKIQFLSNRSEVKNVNS